MEAVIFLAQAWSLCGLPLEHAQFGVRNALSFSTNKVLQALPYLKLRSSLSLEMKRFLGAHFPKHFLLLVCTHNFSSASLSSIGNIEHFFSETE
jgi:hypothetical protein